MESAWLLGLNAIKLVKMWSLRFLTIRVSGIEKTIYCGCDVIMTANNASGFHSIYCMGRLSFVKVLMLYRFFTGTY